jgi:hypothetical protein
MSEIQETKTAVATWEWLETPCDDPIKVERDGDEVWLTYGPSMKVVFDISQLPTVIEMLQRAQGLR